MDHQRDCRRLLFGFDVAWGPAGYGLLEKGDTRDGLGLKCGGRRFGDEDQGEGGAREGAIFLG